MPTGHCSKGPAVVLYWKLGVLWFLPNPGGDAMGRASAAARQLSAGHGLDVRNRWASHAVQPAMAPIHRLYVAASAGWRMGRRGAPGRCGGAPGGALGGTPVARAI